MSCDPAGDVRAGRKPFVKLRQELGKGESLPDGLLFPWGGGGDGEVLTARLAGS